MALVNKTKFEKTLNLIGCGNILAKNDVIWEENGIQDFLLWFCNNINEDNLNKAWESPLDVEVSSTVFAVTVIFV